MKTYFRLVICHSTNGNADAVFNRPSVPVVHFVQRYKIGNAVDTLIKCNTHVAQNGMLLSLANYGRRTISHSEVIAIARRPMAIVAFPIVYLFGLVSMICFEVGGIYGAKVRRKMKTKQSIYLQLNRRPLNLTISFPCAPIGHATTLSGTRF